MEYQIGSLADLISGNKTPNKTKVVQKAITLIKREVKDEYNDEVGKSNEKSPKSPKKKTPKKELYNAITSIKNEKDDELSDEVGKSNKSPKNPKIKTPRKKPNNVADVEFNTPNNKEKKALKNKNKKRKLDTSNNDLVDSDTEESPSKKPKQELEHLTKNEQNAAGRIKNKINKEIKNSSEYKDRTLFVGNIPINLKKEKIKKRFRKYGEIDSVRIRGIPVADPKTTKKVAAIKKEFHPDRNTVYAFIRFKDAKSCKKAEAENGELFEDHHLRVHCCESDDKPDESKAIFVGNLAFNAEEEELWNLFKPCGPLSHVRIVRDGRTGMGKGFGYVNFKDADSVQLALEMEKVMLKDRELRISVCDSSRAKKKKGPKKPRHRNRVKQKTQENGSDISSEKKNSFKGGKGNPKQFSGTKFDDKKKKKKFNKSVIEKKKLAKKLVAPRPNKQQNTV